MRNKLTYAAYAAVAIEIAAAGYRYVKTIAEERKKRTEIQEEEDRTIEAINLAGQAMKEMIAEGLYDNKLYRVQSDFNELVQLYLAKPSDI